MKPFSLFPNKFQAQKSKAHTPLDLYWSLASEQILASLHTSNKGMPQTEAENRLKQYGPNALKAKQQPTAYRKTRLQTVSSNMDPTHLKANARPPRLGCCCASSKARSF